MGKTGRAGTFRCSSPDISCAFLGVPAILPWSILETLPDGRT